MSLHKLAGISPSHPGSLSCLLYFLCMLAIPIFPLFKFEEFLIYLYIYIYFCIVVRVARYRIASKCFYALLFRRPRGEKYRNNSVYGSSTWLYHRLQTLGPSSARVETPPRASANEGYVGLYVGS